MKVLHLPYNIANWVAINVKMLNENGVEAKAIIFGEKNQFHSHEGLVYIPQKNAFQKLQSIAKFKKYLKWADIIHWYFDDKIIPGNLALKIIRRMRIPAVVEWLGSDIRDPKVEFQDNPYFEEVFSLLYKESPEQVSQNTLKLQKKFAEAGFYPVLCPDMKQYLKVDLFQDNFTLRQRIEVKRNEGEGVSKNAIPRIAHAPSKKTIKGTKYIIGAIDTLRAKGYRFDFDLIYNVSHDEAIDRIGNCDLFVDQLILGVHGMSALEAMSMGKPVISYIKDSLIKTYPEDLPIIIANPTTITTILQEQLDRLDILPEIGKLSKDYVLEYHDTSSLFRKQVEIYEQVIRLKGMQ